MAALGSAANTIETGESDVVHTSAYAGAAMQVELGNQLEIFHGDEWHAALVVGQGRNLIQMEATANGRFESFDVPLDRAAYFLRAPQLPAASRPRESYLEGRGAFAPGWVITIGVCVCAFREENRNNASGWVLMGASFESHIGPLRGDFMNNFT